MVIPLTVKSETQQFVQRKNKGKANGVHGYVLR